MKEIEKIIKAYSATNWEEEKAALGTVVKVEESAYRRIGARMYVSSKGDWTGGISGGCLEGDALKRAQIAINKNQSSIVVYDTMDDDSHQIGVGLGCNGLIEVMFTPIDPSDASNPIEFLKTITDTRETEALLQILNNDRQEADKAGRDSLIGKFYPYSKLNDLIQTTGISREDIDTSISEAKRKRKSRVFNLSNRSEEKFEILVELIRPKIKVICIGDNYDVNAFVSIVHEMGWEIHVAGKLRKLSKELFSMTTTTCEYNDVPKITIDEHTAVVLMSHDYKTDYNLLQHFIKHDVPYIGLLGPKKRMIKMQNELADEGKKINLESMPNLFSPVGLDIGAESPEEISLSIASEIITTLRRREGTSLRKRLGPIHERD